MDAFCYVRDYSNKWTDLNYTDIINRIISGGICLLEVPKERCPVIGYIFGSAWVANNHI